MNDREFCEICTDECTEEGFLPFGGVCRKCDYTCREHLGYFLDPNSLNCV